MPQIYPKFDQKINDQISNHQMQQPKTRTATVVAYDKVANQVTLVLDAQYSDTIGNIIDKVNCPVSYRNTNCSTRTRRQVYSWFL